MFFYNVLLTKFKLLVDLFLVVGVKLEDKSILASESLWQKIIFTMQSFILIMGYIPNWGTTTRTITPIYILSPKIRT
jgi:hypothetical protein